jgi:xylulokinase
VTGVQTCALPISEIVGGITPAAARETGLAEGTPVTTGTVDAAAEALSVGVTRPGDMMMMYGSTIFIIALTGARVRDSRLWYAPWLFEGQHASMAGLATSGTVTHWFRDQLARDLDPRAAFALLAEEAEASPPGAKGLIFLPYFSGERTPIHDPFAKGCLFGLNLTHTRGDMYRAVLEGIAHGTNHVIETYRDVGQAPLRLLAVGGGTQNRVWCQATSDISGIDQILCEKSIGASYGDAFMAAVAIGEAEIDDIAAWNPVTSTITAEASEGYRKQDRLFRKLYEQTKDIASKLSKPD